MQTPAALPVAIVANPMGGGSITIDGIDYTDGTERVWFEMGDGPATLTLQRARDAVAIEGAAVVQIAEPGGMAAAAEIVRSLDAQEVRQAAMASDAIRQGGGSADATFAAVLEVVAEALERSG